MSTTSTTTTRDRGDRYGPIEWAQKRFELSAPNLMVHILHDWTPAWIDPETKRSKVSVTGYRHAKYSGLDGGDLRRWIETAMYWVWQRGYLAWLTEHVSVNCRRLVSTTTRCHQLPPSACRPIGLCSGLPNLLYGPTSGRCTVAATAAARNSWSAWE